MAKKKVPINDCPSYNVLLNLCSLLNRTCPSENPAECDLRDDVRVKPVEPIKEVKRGKRDGLPVPPKYMSIEEQWRVLGVDPEEAMKVKPRPEPVVTKEPEMTLGDSLQQGLCIPSKPIDQCRCCGGNHWWLRQPSFYGGSYEWLCNTCHPPPDTPSRQIYPPLNPDMTPRIEYSDKISICGKCMHFDRWRIVTGMDYTEWKCEWCEPPIMYPKQQNDVPDDF